MSHIHHYRHTQLNPPTKGWIADLDEPNAPVNSDIQAPMVRINYVDDTYLEVSRRKNTVSSPFRMLYTYAMGLVIMVLFAGLLAFALCYDSRESLDIALILISLVILPIGLWLIVWAGLNLLRVPRDTPIRFNRKRQQVYIFNAPLGMKGETSFIKVDWQDIRVELYERTERIASPHSRHTVYKQGLDISMVKHGTNQVLLRLNFFDSGKDLEQTWEYIRCYMQHGLSYLPNQQTPNYANQLTGKGLLTFLRAPVVWPSDVDQESCDALSEATDWIVKKQKRKQLRHILVRLLIVNAMAGAMVALFYAPFAPIFRHLFQ